MSIATKQRNRDIGPIDDAVKLRNAKCKRTKCLYRKSYELSILCNLDVNIQIYDRSSNRITEFSTNSECTPDHLTQLKNENSKLFSDKRLKVKSMMASDLFNIGDQLSFKN